MSQIEDTTQKTDDLPIVVKLENTLNYNYEANKPINVYEIKDREARNVFNGFLDSVSSIFEVDGKQRVNGGDDYSQYVYWFMSLGESVKHQSKIKKDHLTTMPTKFFDLLLHEGQTEKEQLQKYRELKYAEIEMMQNVANYMSEKYKKPIEITFDSLYFNDRYVSRTPSLFDENEYNDHIDNIRQTQFNGNLDSFVSVKATPNNIVPAKLCTTWWDDTATTFNISVNLETGEMIRPEYKSDNEVAQTIDPIKEHELMLIVKEFVEYTATSGEVIIAQVRMLEDDTHRVDTENIILTELAIESQQKEELRKKMSQADTPEMDGEIILPDMPRPVSDKSEPTAEKQAVNHVVFPDQPSIDETAVADGEMKKKKKKKFSSLTLR